MFGKVLYVGSCSLQLFLLLVISRSQIAVIILHCFFSLFVSDLSLVDHGADVETANDSYANELELGELDSEVEDVEQEVVDQTGVGDQIDESWRRVLSRDCHQCGCDRVKQGSEDDQEVG